MKNFDKYLLGHYSTLSHTIHTCI